MRKESKRKPLAFIATAVILCCLLAAPSAFGQSKATVPSATSASKSVLLEVFGAQDASVSATPVVRTSPNGEQLLGAYDINLVKDGREWQPQPDEPAIVSMTDPAFIDGKLYDIYHEGTDGVEYIATVAPENGKISFPAPSFSVYIVTETGDYARLKVTFHRTDSTTISLYVKKADITQGDYNTIVYNPGFGTVPNGVACKGWTTNAAYTAATIPSAMTFAMVRDSITRRLNAGVTDGAELHFYTMLFKSFSVSYLDEEGGVVNNDIIAYRADEDIPSTAYEVNAAYTPNDNDNNFEGWKVNTHADGAHIAGHSDDDHNYTNGTGITINGDVVFKVYVTQGKWLIYHENGKGATYKAADFVHSGENTVEPTLEMVRNGYTFVGWFLGEPAEEGGNPTGAEFPFGGPLNENTHVYAKWRPRTSAPYTVIIWKQNIAGGNVYDYDTVISINNGTVGDTINTVTQQGTGNNAYARVNGVNKRYTGFHLDHFDQNVVIKTEGNSVLNIYYNRTEYTLHFQDNITSYIETTGTSGTQYGYYNGAYVRIYYNNGTWYRTRTSGWGGYNYSNPYNGTRYIRTEWTDIKTITALYQQDISSYFPIQGTNGANYAGYVWEPQGSSIFTTGDVPALDAMREENTIFHAKRYGTSRTIHMYYYTEAIGTTGIQYNGRYFEEHLHVQISSSGNITSTEDEDFISIMGYDHLASNPAYSNGSVELNNSNNYTIKFYYTRQLFTINFMDGAYYDGNGERLNDDDLVQAQIGTIPNIVYGADVSPYASYRPDAAHTHAGFVFDGWYVDKLCQQPYNFTTMPNGGITVYAKWRQVQYRVFLHPGIDQATVPRLTWGAANQAMNFRIVYQGRVSAPTGVDQDDRYKFVGWYTDAACTHPFNELAVTLNDANTTPYNKTTDLTDSMDAWGSIVSTTPFPEGTTGPGYNSDSYNYNSSTGTFSPRNRFWITRKYDLYGKWKATLPGAIGITVVYDGNGGTPASDTAVNKYQDNVDAIAQSACTPPSPTQEFSHWVMQRYNLSTHSFEDIPGSVIFPADPFLVLKTNAERVNLLWCDSNDINNTIVPLDPYSLEPPDATHRMIKEAIYTLKLRAEYVDIEQPKHTFITWYKNDGTGAIVRADKETFTPHTLNINQTVTEFDATTPTIPAAPSRTGYTFKGWYKQRTPEGSTVPTTIEQCTPNFLYYKDNKYYKESTFTNEVTKVAADLYQKDDYLYAIWEPIVEFNFDPICGGQTVTLPTTTSYGADLSAATYTWSVVSGGGSISGTSYTVPTSGPVVLRFAPAASTCAEPKNFSFPVNPLPEVSVTPVAGTHCPNGQSVTVNGTLTRPGTTNYNYTWNLGSLSVASGSSATITNTASTSPSVNVIVPTGNCDTTYQIGLTVTDRLGCSFTFAPANAITVLDNEAPTLKAGKTWPSNITDVDSCYSINLAKRLVTTDAVAALYQDNCSDVTVTIVSTTENKTSNCDWKITRKYKISDACGNYIEKEQYISGGDVSAPVPNVTPKTRTTVACSSDTTAAVSTLSALEALGFSFTDCNSLKSAVSVVSNSYSGTSCLGSRTTVYRVFDNCDNHVDVTYIQPVKDSIAPVPNVTSKTRTTVACSSDTTAAVSTLSALEGLGFSFTDCNSLKSAVTVVSNSYSGTACLGSRTTVYRVFDNCDNHVDVTYIQPVKDSIAPVPNVTSKTRTTVACSSDTTAAVSTLSALEGLGFSFTDCNSLKNAVTVVSNSYSGTTCLGSRTTVYRVFDNCDNHVDVTYIQPVKDSIAPVATPTSITRQTVVCSNDTTAAVSTLSELTTLGFTITDTCNTLKSDVSVVSNSYSGTTCNGT